jgi:outer membrane protein OmpA-like peptidoglycan-associated protein/tetratricopeptide (TPR) repeat protein
MNVKTLILLTFIGLSGSLLAQSKFIKEANSKFYNENYCEGAEKCAQAYTKIARKGNSALKVKGDMAFKTAECYRLTENFKEANEWYEKAILLKYQQIEPLVLLHNAECWRTMGDFKKAKENYSAYKALVPDDSRADIGLKSCEMHEDFKENKTRHLVTNIEKLNLDGFEMAPMFVDKKETVVAFSSSRSTSTGTDEDPRTCEKYMDIYVSALDKKGNWTEPKLIEAEGVNTEDNEGTICIDSRGKTMFFTRCPNVKKQNLGCDIWWAEAKGKSWDVPVKLNLKTADSVSVGHPCVSEDGKYLIFASDMDGNGSMGGRDLWYTTYNKKNEEWTAPVNMGPEINTAGDELFPSFGLNGELIYASNGLPGMGGLDIFKAVKVGEEYKWENPTNLGSPINSDYNDYALVEATERKGYFTSERKGSKGENYKPDLYQYELPPNIFDLKVNVSDLTNKEKKLEGVKVTVTGSTAGDKWEGVTASDGSVFWDKKPNGDRYVNENSSYSIVLAKKDGYYEDKNGSKFTTVDLGYDQNFIIDMALIPEKPIRLPEVRYPLSQWSLLVDSTINSKDSLQFVYDLLTEYPGMVLELSSHTDARGTDNSNQVLSENRAKACYKYLVEERGVDPRRIVPVGKGEREPKTVYKKGEMYQVGEPLDMTGYEKVVLTEAYINQFKKTDKRKFEMLHQLNRRTEGKIITMDFDPATSPAANPDYKVFKPVPKK